jgi:uncharacterized protein (UPF0332 family)
VEGGFAAAAASRGYYAMFYVAQAFLVTIEQAREQVAHAEEFLDVAERVIGPLSPANDEME